MEAIARLRKNINIGAKKLFAFLPRSNPSVDGFATRGRFSLFASAGFSLIEMLVVVGIFAFLSSVVFANYNQFNIKASLDNLTHQVALIIRQAQVYGISVSQIYSSSKAYGVYFSTATPGDQKTFVLFNDRHGPFAGDNAPDKIYNPGPDPCGGVDLNDECVEKVSIQSGDTVGTLKAREKTDPANALTLKALYVVFTRPNPDANILGVDANNNQYDKLPDAEITLQSPKGATKRVVVWSTGQIAVE